MPLEDPTRQWKATNVIEIGMANNIESFDAAAIRASENSTMIIVR
jgi:hypothetical protein